MRDLILRVVELCELMRAHRRIVAGKWRDFG